MHLYKDLSGKGTYATHANAVKRIETVIEQFEIDFRFIIAVNEAGRFFPVVVLRGDEQYLAGSLAHQSICVTF